VAAERRLAGTKPAAANLAEGDPAYVIAVIQIRRQELEALSLLRARRRNVFDNHLEQGAHIPARLGRILHGETLLGAGEDKGEIQLLIGRAQGNEELEDLVQRAVGIGVFAVDLVDGHNRLGSGLQRLAQHKPRLGLRSLRRVHHQERPVHHVHDPLDLASEIGVAGRVHQIDPAISVTEGGVLGLDGDAFFPFQVHIVHNPVLPGESLVGAEKARLLEQAIHERRLPVVHVRNDGNVANMSHGRFRESRIPKTPRGLLLLPPETAQVKSFPTPGRKTAVLFQENARLLQGRSERFTNMTASPFLQRAGSGEGLNPGNRSVCLRPGRRPTGSLRSCWPGRRSLCLRCRRPCRDPEKCG